MLVSLLYAMEYNHGFRYPNRLLPLATLSALRRETIQANTGAAREVPEREYTVLLATTR